MTYSSNNDRVNRVVDIFVSSGYPETADVIESVVTDELDRIYNDGYEAGVSDEMGSGSYTPLDADAVLSSLHAALAHRADVFVSDRELVITELENCWSAGYSNGGWDS